MDKDKLMELATNWALAQYRAGLESRDGDDDERRQSQMDARAAQVAFMRELYK